MQYKQTGFYAPEAPQSPAGIERAEVVVQGRRVPNGSGGTRVGDRGRQPEMTEDPPGDRTLVDQRNQAQDAGAGHAGTEFVAP